MGLDHGKIVAIKDTSIELLEMVSGSEPGVWVKRKAKLEILQ
jgi:Tfp pilus assembly protein PilP